MIFEAYKSKDGSFEWLDVKDPSGSDLEAITQRFNLKEEFVRNVLDPTQLAKYEEKVDQTFIILLPYDVDVPFKSGTIRQLTQKISIFIGHHYLITIHRKDEPYLNHIRDHWIKNQTIDNPSILPLLLSKIVSGVVNTYTRVLNECDTKMEHFEKIMFEEKTTLRSIRQKFILQRRSYVIKRILTLILNVVYELKMISEYDPILYQGLVEECENEKFHAENTASHSNELINLVLFTASNSTGETFRVLTIVSVFFLPLYFVSSVYDIHFSSLEYGYLFFWGLLIGVTIFLLIFFRRKGWLWLF